MRIDRFDYQLPERAVAQQPAARRDRCRLAAVDRASGQVRHLRFDALPSLLRPHDLLVLNDSRVLPARIPCRRGSGGAVEVFLLDPAAAGEQRLALLKAGGRLQAGECVAPLREGQAGAFRLISKDDEGRWTLRWEGKRPLSPALLQRLGLPPLPPYIQRARLPEAGLTAKDKRWYQTVYARHAGSVAAPTAGLHFTPGLLAKAQAQGAQLAWVTLHVGAGTFLPVKTETLDEHPMHAETCQLPMETAQAIGRARQNGGRVIAVGTTALRTLESAWLPAGGFRQGWFETRLFLKPGSRFNVVDALLTNFHQPRSTLLPLVAAFWDIDPILDLYQVCLKRGYRFLSYGDACFFY
jgi:S-adenosylmethionine:tRNA ribosyltransferase-isomerase